MNLSAQFKAYLLSLGSSASKVTVKNYVADVNKFIKWFESKYSRSFSPAEVSESTISTFKKESLENYSASSVDRSISSLRKFFTFLKLEGLVSHSPFDEKPKAGEIKETDPWRLKDFKNYLYVFNASHLTIKNYIIDLKQFISWAEEVLKSESNYEVNETNILDEVNSSLINEYKNRLLNEAKLSPVSVNRKLSSLRRYFAWAEEEGIINSSVKVLNETSAKELNEDFGFQIDQDVAEVKSIPTASRYSKFPPIRLAQKVSRAGMLVVDGILILPLVALAHKAEYGIWTLKGRPVVEAASAGFLGGVLKSQAQPVNKVRNVGKEFYAPAKVSLKYYPLHKKAIFHLKHTRPDWYKRNQNTSFVRFAQLAILAILFSALSYAAYSNLGPNKNQTKTLAALPTAPPRILSFQGRLTDTTDNPITTPTALRMAIYDTSSASGSSLLWQEIVTVTPDSDGIFATLLGNNTTIPQSVFAQNSALWLGVSVGQTAELTPRQQIATVAFATNSETLQGLEPITNSASTSNVVLALNSSGNLSIGGSANPVFQSTGGSFTVQGTTLILSTTTGSGGSVRIAPDGLGKIDLQKPLQNNTLNGNINTSRGAVEVNDLFSILATSSGQSAFTLNQESTGPLISASTSGVAKFTVDNGGNLTAAGTINGLTVSNGTISSGTWNGTAISSTYGGTGLNTASSTGVPYISGGTWSVDANALAANHGGTSFTNYAQGDMIYASATNTLSKLTIGGNGTCLTSNGTAPSWGSCATGAGTNWWTTSSDGKALTPINSTMDFLLGGQATSSAKFAFTGLANANNQTQASLSGQLIVMPNNGYSGRIGVSTITPTDKVTISGGGVTFTDDDQGLTFFGGITLKKVSGGNLVTNGSFTSNSLSVGSSGFTVNNSGAITATTGFTQASGAHSFSGGGNFSIDSSAFDVNTSGAVSGVTTLAASGVVTLSNAAYSGNNAVIYGTTSTGVLAAATTSTSGLCLLSGASATFTPSWGTCPGGSSSTNWWTTSSDGKALTPINSTMDFLLGGQATTSAKFSVLGLNGTTPTASISAQNGAASAIYIDPANNSIQNVRNQSFTLGGNSTGNIAISPLNGGTGSILSINSLTQNWTSTTLNASSLATIDAAASLSLDSTTLTLGNGSAATIQTTTGGLTLNSGSNTLTIDATDTTLTASGIATFTTAATLGMTSTTTLNLGNNATLSSNATALNIEEDGGVDVNLAGTSASTGCTITNSSGALACASTLSGTGANFSGLNASSAVYTDGSKNLTTTAPTTGIIGYWSRTAQGTLTPATLNDIVAATSSAYNPFTATTNNPAGTLANNTLIQHVAAGTVTNLLTLSRTAGTVTTGLNLSGTIGTDISLQNGETISNNSDGVVAVTSPLTTFSGNARGAGDDTYFSWDFTTQRIGFTKKSGQTGKLTYGSANSFAIAQSNATDIAATNTFTDRFVIDSSGNISMGGVITLSNAAYTGNNAVIYGTTSTGVLAAATTSTSGLCLISGAGAGFTPSWGACASGSGGTNWWTTSSDGKALTPINSTMDFLLGGQATTSAKFAFTGLSLANNQTQATLSGQLTVVPNNGYGGNASLAAQLTLGSFANPVIQTEKNQTLTIGGNKTGNINIAPLNGATGSNLTLSTINQTWTGTTTVTASSLTTLTTAATLAFSGDIRVNGNDILDSAGTSRITTGATTTLTNTTTTLSGTTTLTAASLATLTSSTTLSMNPNTGTTYTINTTGTTLNLFNTTAATFNFAGAATTFTLGGTTGTMSLRNPVVNVGNGGNATIATTSNGNLTLAASTTTTGTGQILLSADYNTGVQIATAVVATPLAPLYINGGIGNNSAVIINQTNNGNILVASSAGTTRLTIDNTGKIDANSFITGGWTIDVNSPCNGSGRLCFSNNGTAEVSFTTGGQGRFTGGTVTDTPDYAENITVLDQSIESGDIVTSVIYDSTADSIYKRSTASKSIKSYQNEIIGGISENPGFLAAQGNANSLPDDRPWADNERPLTVAGRIPVKVTTQNGSINVGDRITSSDRPGIGMKATEAGQVVGIAMEPYSSPDPQEVKKILVFINPGFYDPDIILTDSGNLYLAPTVDYGYEIKRDGQSFTRIAGYSEIVVANIKGGVANIQRITTQSITGVSGSFQSITSDSLAILTSNITIAGQSIQDFIANIVDQRIAQNGGSGDIISPLETDGGNVAIKLKTNDDKSKLVVKNASGSAVATIDGAGNASLSGQLSASGASISGTLRADRIIANQIEGLNIQASTVSANYITNNYYISTPSGELQNATPSGFFNQSATGSAMFGDLNAQTATFTQGLMSFGPASFFEASVADRLFVGSQLSLADNSINVLGSDLKIQPLRQGDISFMAGLVKIDTDGNLNVGGNSYFAKDVEVKGKLAANIIAPLSGKDLVFQLNENDNNKVQFKNGTSSAFLSINNKGDINASGAGTFAKLNLDIVKEVQAVSDTEIIATGSAGLAEIKANREEVTINNKLVNEDSLIYITPKTAIPNNSVYLIRQVPGESFTVGISDTINKKVQFNWIIIN